MGWENHLEEKLIKNFKTIENQSQTATYEQKNHHPESKANFCSQTVFSFYFEITPKTIAFCAPLPVLA